MDRLISLQAAIDALGDEPEVWTGKDEYAMGLNNQWHYDRNAIKAVPSAQSEIIRCKDCKHYDGRPCEIVDWYNTADDFCSRAERRTDETTI